MTLLFLSLGDPVAALVGRQMPGPRISGKSPVGTIAFIGVCLLVVLSLTKIGVVEYHWGLLVGAVVAGVAELISLPLLSKVRLGGVLDDNLTVPLVSGLVMQFLGV
jgi:dolichol kinase